MMPPTVLDGKAEGEILFKYSTFSCSEMSFLFIKAYVKINKTKTKSWIRISFYLFKP